MTELPILPPLHEWHPVPVGATIPAGTPYMVCECDGEYDAFLAGAKRDIEVTSESQPHWTPEPLAPPLPTEHGAQIFARVRGDRLLSVLTLTSGEWRLASIGLSYDVASIVEWAPLPADLVWHTR